ncbi:SOS response-associated peptidase [Lacrimispora amygdalina]|uniref:Abasic site processing protein n=1 Tax=Lacrimispora amygdalina TaxID=253257 RepID=A0A3E2N4X5_9FIRM|nr:SOS response-associated peptidase [Clostridium indicum]RFZ75951.1 SOS response-associated peptidase [Clostridium indicum]
MCGRYYIEIDNAELSSIIAAVERKEDVKTGEIYPTNIAPVLSSNGTMTAMRWGFPKFDGKGEIINARSETAAEKNTFRRPMMEGRCLIPASWYFEWEKRGSKKIKYALAPPDNSPVWMAGLSKIDHKTGESLFVVLTRPAWSGISFIHDRMPVILPREIHDEWLNGHDPVGTMRRSIEAINYKEI